MVYLKRGWERWHFSKDGIQKLKCSIFFNTVEYEVNAFYGTRKKKLNKLSIIYSWFKTCVYVNWVIYNFDINACVGQSVLELSRTCTVLKIKLEDISRHREWNENSLHLRLHLIIYIVQPDDHMRWYLGRL